MKRLAALGMTGVIGVIGVLGVELGVGTGAVAVAAPGRGVADAAVRSEADWILAAQLPDGAIARHLDRVSVSPYLANYAAMGLAAAATETGDRAYADAAWRWVRWYRDHQDERGFVTDYDVVGGGLRSTGDMDSTDAYAGTYLLAVHEAWSATGDLPALRDVAPGIVRAVGAIEQTQDVDGLTWAKPTWHVKYLMDQAEAHAGLVAAAELARVLGDDALAARAGGAANRIERGVARATDFGTEREEYALLWGAIAPRRVV